MLINKHSIENKKATLNLLRIDMELTPGCKLLYIGEAAALTCRGNRCSLNELWFIVTIKEKATVRKLREPGGKRDDDDDC